VRDDAPCAEPVNQFAPATRKPVTPRMVKAQLFE
jgi:hypothetical protein